MRALVRLSSIVPILVVIGIWHLAARLVGAGELFPEPLDVAVRILGLMQEDLPVQIWRSLVRLAAGLAIATILGGLIGMATATNSFLDRLFAPVLRSLYPLPKSALIPVVIIWLGLGDAAKISLVFLGCILPIVVSTQNAIREVPTVLRWSARSLGAGPLTELARIAFPYALPTILNGIRTALGIAFILVVSAELIMAKDGMGYVIYILGESGDFTGMFGSVIVVGAVGLVADFVFALFAARLSHWATAKA
jgi:NitT/TauT family transport system permease protein